MFKKVAKLAVVVAAAYALKHAFKKEEPILLEIDQMEDTNKPDTTYPFLGVNEVNLWQNRIKLKLQQCVGKEYVTTRHYLRFNNQTDLFNAIKYVKDDHYFLNEVDDQHQVILEKQFDNFYEDIEAGVFTLLEVAHQFNGVYQDLDIK